MRLLVMVLIGVVATTAEVPERKLFFNGVVTSDGYVKGFD